MKSAPEFSNFVREIAGINHIASKNTYIGLFLLAMATLLYELLLTRIFSLTLWYHFAFMAISIAMFGLSCGAIIIYLNPQKFPESQTQKHISMFSLAFSLSIIISVFAHQLIQSSLTLLPLKLAWPLFVILSFPAMALPFLFSGAAVTLALTRFPAQIARLYASDLAGAAFACMLFPFLISNSDCFTAILAAAALASAAAYYFSLSEAEGKKLNSIASITCMLALILASCNLVMTREKHPFLSLRFIKGIRSAEPIYEKWNSFSRIQVYGDPATYTSPNGWGMSLPHKNDSKVKQLVLDIDGAAGTVLTAFSGDKTDIAYLAYDITNIAHYLKKKADVLVIGVGGGRDLLSCLVFDQRSVLGVEINKDIVEILTSKFADFTGRLDKIQGLRIVNDEARSFISRSKEKFDLIQVSLIDTWAATAAGGLSLSENSLYTQEAWQAFLNHLNDGGILSFSRWYGNPPSEVYKLLVLAKAALKNTTGSDSVEKHILLVRSKTEANSELPPVATILVSKTAFADADLARIKALCQELDFDLLLPAATHSDSFISIFANESSLPQEKIAQLMPELDLRAPTDDRPYFFQMLSASRMLPSLCNFEALNQAGNAILVLFWLFASLLVLTGVCIIAPLTSRLKSSLDRKTCLSSAYFISIGFAFMLIEIAQMQRLSVFLGHPSYSLTVILFSLLLSGGLGSLSLDYPGIFPVFANKKRSLLILVLLVFASGLASQPLCVAMQSGQTALRIFAGILLTMPAGFFMGMAFPIGLRLVSRTNQELLPWFWGLNGAASVLASVIAVIIALIFGISAAYFTGAGFYLLSLLVFLRMQEDKVQM